MWKSFCCISKMYIMYLRIPIKRFSTEMSFQSGNFNSNRIHMTYPQSANYQNIIIVQCMAYFNYEIHLLRWVENYTETFDWKCDITFRHT